MRDALLVALGGATGSVLRWWLSGAVARMAGAPTFPWGTLAVNLLGSFAIGALLGLTEGRDGLAPHFRLLLVTGVLGGFTTFSAFSWETLALVRGGTLPAAIAYATGSVAGGLLAALAGLVLTRR